MKLYENNHTSIIFSRISFFSGLAWLTTFTNPHIIAIVNSAAALSLISFLLWLVSDRNYRKIGVIEFFIVTFVLVLAASIEFSQFGIGDYGDLKNQVIKPLIMALIIGITAKEIPNAHRNILIAIIMNAVMMSTISSFQFAHEIGQGRLPWEAHDLSAYRWLSDYAVFVESFLVAGWLQKKNRFLSNLSFLLLVFQIPIIIFTGARAAYGAILIGFILTYFLIKGINFKGIAISLARIASIAIPIIIISPPESMLSAKINQGFESKERFEVLYPNSIKLIEASPVLGYGFDQQTYRMVNEKMHEKLSLYGSKHTTHTAHNIFLETAVRSGIAGLASLVLLILISLYFLGREFISNTETRYFTAPAIATILSVYLARGLVETTSLYFIVASIALAISFATKKQVTP